MPWHGAALRVRLAISGEASFEQFVELESVAHGPRLERKHEIVNKKTRPRFVKLAGQVIRGVCEKGERHGIADQKTNSNCSTFARSRRLARAFRYFFTADSRASADSILACSARAAADCQAAIDGRNKIVVEESHNYRVHIFADTDPQAPKLYQLTYDCELIRRSIGAESKPHLGNWQGWLLERV
jgi:hypothetical protein